MFVFTHHVKWICCLQVSVTLMMWHLQTFTRHAAMSSRSLEGMKSGTTHAHNAKSLTLPCSLRALHRWWENCGIHETCNSSWYKTGSSIRIFSVIFQSFVEWQVENSVHVHLALLRQECEKFRRGFTLNLFSTIPSRLAKTRVILIRNQNWFLGLCMHEIWVRAFSAAVVRVFSKLLTMNLQCENWKFIAYCLLKEREQGERSEGEKKREH